jgi:hypothetical protein
MYTTNYMTSGQKSSQSQNEGIAFSQTNMPQK